MPTDLNLTTADVNFVSRPEIRRGPSDPSSLRTDDIQPPKYRFTNRQFTVTREEEGPLAAALPIQLISSNLITSDINAVKQRSAWNGTGTRPNFSLDVRDIDGAQPARARVLKPRETNPLDPVYQLPSFEPEPDLIPRFVRDNMDLSDVDGSSPKPLFRFATRGNKGSDDISGASSRPRWNRPERKGEHYDSLNTRDITHTGFKSTRVTDPLSPVYRWSSTTDLAQTLGMVSRDEVANSSSDADMVGAIGGDKPRALPRQRAEHERYALRTDDILRPVDPTPNEHKHARTQWRNTNNTLDIDGAQPHTRKQNKPLSDRTVNPLVPAYVWPITTNTSFGSAVFGNKTRASTAQPKPERTGMGDISLLCCSNHAVLIQINAKTGFDVLSPASPVASTSTTAMSFLPPLTQQTSPSAALESALPAVLEDPISVDTAQQVPAQSNEAQSSRPLSTSKLAPAPPAAKRSSAEDKKSLQTKASPFDRYESLGMTNPLVATVGKSKRYVTAPCRDTCM